MQTQNTKNKRAFFVIGPESSGTRMLTEAFIKCGAYGCSTHLQKLDVEGFKGDHELIVFRRSVPHGKHMPKIQNIIKRLQKNGYEVIPVVILRDKDACVKSQISRKHAKSEMLAKKNIENAIKHIFDEFSKTDLKFITISYEALVQSKEVQKWFFGLNNFEIPDMAFYDANLKYKKGENE